MKGNCFNTSVYATLGTTPEEAQMNIQTPKPQRTPVWLTADSGDFETFLQIVGQTANPADTRRPRR